MKVRGLVAAALSLALVLGTAEAQAPYPPPGTPPPLGAPVLYAPPQLDQMLAALALYPDPLLTQILTAATYPYEVDAAARWLQVPQDAALGDGQLFAALQAIDWDPSVKSLVPFPQVLFMLDQHLDWTQAIGNAFLAQPSDVMDSIQRLRHEAFAAGTLVSSPYINVVVDGPYIEILPVSQQEIFIPVYDPDTAYGAWPYAAYPPFYYGPPPGMRVRGTVAGIGFSAGFGVVSALWDWGDWDWAHHDVRVDPGRFNQINAGHPPVAAATWQHDPAHRDGVPYVDAKSRAAYQKPVPGSPDQRQQYRFYQAPPASPAPPSRSPPAPLPQVVRGPPSAAAPAPTAFGGFDRGAAPQAEVERGQRSRQAAAATPVAAPRPPAPAARSAPPPARGPAPEQSQPQVQRPPNGRP